MQFFFFLQQQQLIAETRNISLIFIALFYPIIYLPCNPYLLSLSATDFSFSASCSWLPGSGCTTNWIEVIPRLHAAALGPELSPAAAAHSKSFLEENNCELATEKTHFFMG